MRKKTQKVFCLATRYDKNTIFIHKFIYKKTRDDCFNGDKKLGLSCAKWEEVDTWYQ